MDTSPDWLVNLFFYVFLFGLAFTIISLVLGVSHVGGFDLGGDVDVDVDLGGDGSSDSGGDGPGPFNLPTIMAFVTWFGGAGYIFTRSVGLAPLLAVPLALVSGLVGGAVMFLVIARLLWPMLTRPMESIDFQLPGTPARVVSSIREGGMGEIVYRKAGSRFTAGARSADGSAVARGTEVVILSYERGVASVQAVDSILRGEANVALSSRKNEETR
jgi:hypothetical protein